MSSIIEKPDGTIVVTVRLTLKPGKDDHLIKMVKEAKRRKLASAIRNAMNNGVNSSHEDEERFEINLDDMGIDL